MKKLLALGLFLPLGATVYAQSTTVTVRDRTGAVVAGADVEILAGPTVAASAKTGEEGTARVSLAAGTYRARVSTPGFVVGYSEVFRQRADSNGAAAVTLFPGSALAGTVLDEEDRKISGVELCVSLHRWRTFPPAAFGKGLLEGGKQCWKTDPQGQIVTPVLPEGRYDLALGADEMVPRKTTVTLERGHAPQIWRLARGGSVKGMVVDGEDKPVEGATVRLRHRELEAERRGATGGDGRFEIKGLAAGPWSVRIEPLDAAVILRDGTVVREKAATDLGTLRVRPGLSVEGFVVDVDGGPVGEAKIQVRKSDHAGRPLRTVESGEDGSFVAAGLAEQPVNLLVDAPEGYASIALEEIEPPRRDLEIELQRTGSVCGTVLTRDGRVASGVRVRALPRDLGLLDRHEALVEATTRQVDPETGRFCIDEVHPGEGVKVTARAAGYRPASVEVDVVPGQEAASVELTLERGLTLDGTVVDAQGRPLADAAVRARGVPMVYTDAFGEFSLGGLAPGMNKVTGEHADYAMAERDVMLPLADDEEFQIRLGQGGIIEGSVRRAGGEPVEGVPVALSDPERERLTDADGRFRFDGVPPGERSVTRKARDSYDDFERRRVEVVENETVRIDFTLGNVMEGLVLRGGVPVPGVTITLAQPNDVTSYTDTNHNVQRTFSDESGAYRLSGVRPGWGTVTLEHHKQTTVRQIEVPPGDSPRLDLRLPDRPIRGTVVNAGDDSGVGRASVTVTLAPAEGAPESGGSSSYSSSEAHDGIRYNLTSSASCRTYTDASGSFEAYADPLPEVEIGAWAEGFRWQNVKIDPENAAAVRIELSPETKLIVKLFDAQGNGVRRAEVCAVLRKDDGNTSTNCSMGGSEQVPFSLDEGTYRIQASAAGFGTKVLERELKRKEDGSAHTVTVTLVPGAPLKIRLVGQPVEGARVVSLIDPGGADRTELVRDGSVDPATGDRRWTTWGLDPGLWTLTLDDGSGDAIVREVQVVPGPPVEVVLPQ